MIRYRIRRKGEGNEWGTPRRLWRVMRRVRREQLQHGRPSRFRRRDQQWSRWYRRHWRMRAAFRLRLGRGRLGFYQFQVGGIDGPVFGVAKYRVPPPVRTPGERVIAAGLTMLGTPYGFGEANGPEDPGSDVFDCSGFTQWAWSTEGVFLPHAARLQQDAPNVDTFDGETEVRAGDLVFMWFPNSRDIPRGTASHVGLWHSPGRMLDTRNPLRPVAVRDIESDHVIEYGRPRSGGRQV